MKSLLLDKTLELLENRPRSLTMQQISNDTGLTMPWLTGFASRVSKGPQVTRVETLYTYLSGKKLRL